MPRSAKKPVKTRTKKPVSKSAKHAGKITDDGRHYPARPVVGIGVVVWRGDKVLLVKRGHAPRKNEWGLPGGAQNLGETIMRAASREVREETGLDITPLGIVTALDAVIRDGAGKIEYHYTLIEVAAEAGQDDEGGGRARAGSDATGVCWATLEEVAKLCRWPEVERVVRLSLLQRAL
jgi:ADP-ribose pyrophosphatase YjhB (NUDIX family)